jgi:glycosyltransferase involved in cell wall biosynthesis
MILKKLEYLTVAVVIPTSGRVRLLRRALESLASSNMVPNEVIVVADSSVEYASDFLALLSEEFDKKFQKLICYQSSDSSGPSSTRNAGLSRVSSDYVAFLDDDDEFLPEKLDVQIHAMLESNAVFCFSDYYRVSKGSSTYVDCALNPSFKGNFAREIAFGACRVATPTVVVKTAFIRQLMPLFPTHMALREDNYAWLRISLTAGFRVVHVNRALAKVHLAENSIQRPLTPKVNRKTPLVSFEDKEIVKLAQSLGLRKPYFYFAILPVVRFLVRSRDRWRGLRFFT